MLKSSIFFLAILISTPLLAVVEGQLAVYSNYIWRGTTFSENRPAVQGDIDWLEKNGFFLGTFFSNAEFTDEALGDSAQVTNEIDYLVGKQWSGDKWEFQFVYNRYTFPGAEVFNADDFSLTGNYKSFYFEVSYMDDYFGYRSTYQYYRLGYGWSYANAVESTLYVGYNAFGTPKGNVKSRCLADPCSALAQTTLGAGNPDYIDVYFLNRKELENGMVLELAFNFTNRKEYLVEDNVVSKEPARDFSTVLGLVIPFTL